MGDVKLQGSQGLWNNPAQLQHRVVDKEITAAQVAAAGKDNNLDELVVTDKAGQMHVIYADELSVKGGSLPKPGAEINLPFIDGPVTVVQVDDEINEDRAAMVIGPLSAIGPKTWSGDDSALRGLSKAPDKVPFVPKPLAKDANLSPAELATELKWLDQFEKDVANGHEASVGEIDRFEAAYVAKLKADPNVP